MFSSPGRTKDPEYRVSPFKKMFDPIGDVV
jgi:hypothetical protein